MLTKLDTWSRICPVLRVCRLATAWEVISALDETVWRSGMLEIIPVDQGCHFTSRELDLRAYSRGVTLDCSRLGKPTDNSFVEAFNGKVRAECIDQNWFFSLTDARLKCEAFRHEYNCERPRSSIGHKTPSEFIKSIGAPSQPMGP